VDFGGVISNAVSSASFTDAKGIGIEVNSNQDNPFLHLEPAVLQQDNCGAQLRLTVRNIGKERVFLNSAAVIDVSAKWQGGLELGGAMSQWTILKYRELHDLCDEWFEKYISDYYAPYYAVIGNRASGKCLTVGFVSFSRQDTRIKLKAARDPFKFQSLRAICDFAGAPLAPGEEVHSEVLFLNWVDEPRAALGKYVDLLMAGAEQKLQSANVIGWSTWDYYLSKVTEDDVLENAKWLAERKAELRVEYIQIDHGFEKCEGDWLTRMSSFLTA